MTTTQDDMNNNDAEFAAAFAEDIPAAAEVSEDEAFGIMPDTPVEDGSSDGNSDAIGGALAPAETVTQADEQTEALAGTPEPGAQDEGAQVVEQQPSPEDIQRQKSWEGRLRAREAELAAKEAELKAMAAQLQGVKRADGGEITPDDLEPQAHEAAEPAQTEAVEDAAEQLESGKPVDAVIQSLRDDFGDDFVSAIESLVQAKAAEIAERMVGEKVGDVSGALDGVMNELQDRDARAHFQAIAKVHPDFMEVASGEGMQAYLASLPENERQAAEAVIDGGGTEDVIALIEAVKGHGQPQQASAEDDEALSNAEGVRSAGMKLPEKPTQADDYSAAWAEF